MPATGTHCKPDESRPHPTDFANTIIVGGEGVELNQAIAGLLYQPQMMMDDDECGAFITLLLWTKEGWGDGRVERNA
jgi:hypothetical protein